MGRFFQWVFAIVKDNLEGVLGAPADLGLVRLVEKWPSVCVLTLSCQLRSLQGGNTNLIEDIFDVQSNTEPSPPQSHLLLCVLGPMWLYLYKDINLIRQDPS